MRVPGACLVVLAVTLASAAPALGDDVTWRAVTGSVTGQPIDAARDGSQVLVLSRPRRGLAVTRVVAGRVTGRQMITRGAVRQARVLVTRRGIAVVAWSTNGSILAAQRRPGDAHFRAPRLISRHPGSPTGAAAAPGVAVASDGRVLIAWWGGPANGALGIQTAEMSAAGVWGPPVNATGRTYPQRALGSVPVGVTAAAAPDGGWAVSWSQVTSPAPLETAFALMAARRSRTGPWQAPTALAPAFAVRPALAAGAGGEVVAAWTEGRDPRPDGVASTVCLMAARSVGAAVARREVTCGPLSTFGSGEPLLVRASDGGTLAAFKEAATSSVQAFARSSGSDDWSGPILAVAGTRGVSQIDGFRPIAGARALLATQVVFPVRPRDGGRVRLVLLRPDGPVISRADGPPTPGRPRSFLVTQLGLGPSRPQLLALWTDGRSSPARYRLSLGAVAPPRAPEGGRPE